MTTWKNSQRCTHYVFHDVFMIFQHVALCSLIPKRCTCTQICWMVFSCQGEIIRRKTASRQSREGNGLSAYLRYKYRRNYVINAPTELLGSDVNIHHRCGM